MQKLGALDANFLYTETGLTPNHVASVQKFELPEGITPQAFVLGLKEFLQARLHLVPYLHRKLKWVPGNLDHPFWVEADVDMDFHVVEVPLAAPGTMAQLESKVAELHEINMDRNRPLWKFSVITGLEDGTVAYYNQVHHAAVDGMGAQTAITTLMDESPEHPIVPRPEPVAAEENGLGTLFQMSLENLLKYQLGSATRMLGNMESLRRLAQRAADPTRGFGAYLQRAPRTRFNNTVGKQRSYGVGELPLGEVRAMGRQLDCTVNDVFLAVCAGGLRRYLKRCGELPSTGLIAGCPVSLRKGHDKNMGNQVTMMSVDLSTQVEDPRLRLLAIHESALTAKEVCADLAEALDTDFALPGLPGMIMAAVATAEQTGIANRVTPVVNVVISNVPGPRNELYSNGARMLTHYPVSIPAHGVGLNITVQSYAGKMYFGVTGCAKALPDAGLLRDDMLASFVELRQLLVPTNITTFRAPAVTTAPGNPAQEAPEPLVTRVA